MDRKRLEANLALVRGRIAEALRRSGRADGNVTLVAVTKGRTAEDVRLLYDLGQRHFGENRVPEAQAKIGDLPKDIQWHMIGSVQRRKARDVVQLFQRVDSVDRIQLAASLNVRCAERGVVLPVLVEVNVSGEESKHGLTPEGLAEALRTMSECANLQIQGLMTMAPICEDPEQVRPHFRRLRKLALDNGLQVISMGMSGDYEVAVEEGATEVRIGSALFA